MLRRSVLYDPTLRHKDLDGKINGKGVYHHKMIGNSTYTLHIYQVYNESEASHDTKVKIGCFWSELLCNTFTHKISPEAQFEISDNESDTISAKGQPKRLNSATFGMEIS